MGEILKKKDEWNNKIVRSVLEKWVDKNLSILIRGNK